MSVRGIDQSAGSSRAITEEVQATPAPSQVSSATMSRGQSFGRDYVFLPPEAAVKRGQEGAEEQQEKRARDRFATGAAILGFAFCLSILAVMLICVIRSAAPGYNAGGYSGGLRSTEQPAQSDFAMPANCSEDRSDRRCR